MPKELVKLVPRTHLLSEQEWRAIGVQQSQGWIHYMIHEPGMQLITFHVTASYSEDSFNLTINLFRATYSAIQEKDNTGGKISWTELLC